MSNNNLQKLPEQDQPENHKSIFEGLSALQKEPVYTAQTQQLTRESIMPSYKASEPSFHGTEFIFGFVLAFVAMLISKKMFKL